MSLPLADMMPPMAVILCKGDSTGITAVCTEEEAIISLIRYTMTWKESPGCLTIIITQKAITDSAVSFVRTHDVHKPMFLYLAHYAPHLPLQAPEKYVERCMERYRAGYDVLRKQRFESRKASNLFLKV